MTEPLKQTLRTRRGHFDTCTQAQKRQKVLVPGPLGQVQVPRHQICIADGSYGVNTEIRAPAIGAGVLNGTAPFEFIVESQSVQLWKNAVLRFGITANTSDTTDPSYMPIQHWFDRIEYFHRADNREIQREHGDSMWIKLASQPRGVIEAWADMCNYDSKTMQPSLRKFHSTGGRTDFYLPLIGHFTEGLDLDLSMMKGDLLIRFHPKGEIRYQDPASAGTLDTTNKPTLNEIQLIVGSEQMTEVSRIMHRASILKAPAQNTFLDVQRFTVAAQTFTASTAVNIDLEQLHHNVAFLAVMIRAADTNYSSTINQTAGAIRYVSLGPRGTIDHEGTSGRSLLGMGTPLAGDYFRSVIGTQFFGWEYTKHNPVYLIPFSVRPKDALSGTINGFRSMVGDRERLRLTPDAAGTAAAFTITVDTAATGGSWALAYKGSSSPSVLYNDSTANMATAFNQIPELWREGLQITTVAESGSAALGDGTVTFTVTDLGGQPVDVQAGDWTVITHGAAEAEVVAAGIVTQTQDYVPGFLTGSYQVDVYSFYHRHVTSINMGLHAEDV